MISGFICAIFRNNWHETGEQSSGFYVAPEGMLSGLIFVVGNITGTFSVKACGLGNYYTVHQVTNLGITFLVGVYGPSLGVPSTPPHDVGLAALGFLCVLIGMMPIMFMEKDSNGASSAPTKPLTSFPEDAEAEPISPGGAGRPPTKLDLLFQEHQGDAQSEQSPVGSSPSPSRVPISPRPSKVLEHRQVPGVDPGSSGTLGLQKPLLGFEKPMLSFKKPMLEPVKTSFRQLNAFTWDGTLGRPVFSKEPNSPPLSCLGDISMVVKEIDDEGEFDDSPNFEGDPARALSYTEGGIL
ncbi:unnamed protein product [Polarella glacialis]|uniref:Uncharacterized protein n=1 Tax=Polarella glacialis TaxID=89957 RepID=A0A813KIJ9_POLGL|nr:unnamed protein product [Polarella glacialis]